jgi:membrane-associated phospholipid phosphatase
MENSRAIVRGFVFTWIALLVVAIAALLLNEKLALHARINCCHVPMLEAFFSKFTHVADGLVPTVLALLLLIVRDVRSFLMVGLSCGMSAVIAQMLKRVFFADAGRPSVHREALGAMDWVEGIDLHAMHSFPSGHSTAAFSMCLALAVVFGQRNWAVPFALLAALLAFSRVYLSQHFLVDITAGSAIGTLTAVAVAYWLYQSPFARKPWLTRRLFRRG